MNINKKCLPLYIALFFSTTIFVGCSDDDEVSSFIGNWNIEEVCDGNEDSYTITISEISGNEVSIFNLWDYEDRVSGTVDGNTLTIPFQEIYDETYEGSGTLSGNTLNLNFKFSEETCTGIGTM